jgi:hypothetical protein
MEGRAAEDAIAGRVEQPQLRLGDRLAHELQVARQAGLRVIAEHAQSFPGTPYKAIASSQIGAVAAPGIFPGRRGQPGPYRVKVYIAQQGQEIAVLLHQPALEPCPENMPAAPMAHIEVFGIGQMYPADGGTDIGQARHDQQVHMVRHQGISIDGQGQVHAAHPQQRQVAPPVGVVQKDLAPVITPRDNVIQSSRKSYPHRIRQIPSSPKR